MTFDPIAVKAKVGDIVVVQSQDPGHNIESVPGMLPAGATAIHGAMGKTVSITFTKPGIYGLRCLPHYGLGMIVLVEVGAPVNLAEAKEAAAKAPPAAKKRFAAAFTKLGL